MNRILFVDDEPKILMALRRSLRSLRNQWEMVFAEGGTAGLQECKSAPFDVVVSDARMPGMEGSEFLNEVARLYPDTIRVVLSGQCSRNSVLRCVAVAHQFLSKPCDPEILKNTLRRVCDTRSDFHYSSHRAEISRVQRLPSQRHVYRQLANAMKSPQVSIDDLAEILVRDVAMTARIIQLVSSGFFGSPQRVENAAEAAKFLGQETIGVLVDSAVVFGVTPQQEVEEELQRISDHSLAVAAAAKLIAKTLTNDRTVAGDAYVSGALHEVGILALAGKTVDGEEELTPDKSGNQSDDFAKLAEPNDEWRLDPGGYLAALWGLPDPVVQAISYHGAPDCSTAEPLPPLVAVHVANALLEPCRETGNAAGNQLNKDFLQKAGYGSYLQQWQDICGAEQQEGALR